RRSSDLLSLYHPYSSVCRLGMTGRGHLFFILSKMASVSLIFFWGLALTTLRNRKPLRLSTPAIVLGVGKSSSRYPCALSASKAALAVSRVEVKLVRNVGSCCACT